MENKENEILDVCVDHVYLLVTQVMLRQGKTKEEIFQFIADMEEEGERIDNLSEDDQADVYDAHDEFYDEYISYRVGKELNF